MRVFVHFSVGVSGVLFVLLFVDLEFRHGFLLTFTSGFWALVPDVGWMLLRVGLPEATLLWKELFNSVLGNLFWFHPTLDAIEPENRIFEMVGGFVLLGLSVGTYYSFNNWESGGSQQWPRSLRRR